ncbi:MAG: DUF971 domain-containing protein [Planctomycetota bacterium]
MTSHVPLAITTSDPKGIAIEWEDGHKTTFTAAELRALCPCARCVDEASGIRTHDPASVPADLTQGNARLVGRYALAVRFSDGHDTGIFPFRALRELDPDRP